MSDAVIRAVSGLDGSPDGSSGGGMGELARVRTLFLEYGQSLGFSLCFQGFDAELASLPGAYTPPAGGLWLAWAGTEAVGCVGMRPLAETNPDRVTGATGTTGAKWCEMKRLYVVPAWRGRALGRRLAETAIAAGRTQGYTGMRLDTLERMTEARALYTALGFGACARYYDNPLPEVRYCEMRFVLETPT